jgi:hypothetical protein
MSTHIRLGAHRIEIRSKGSLKDACDLLGGLTRGNLRTLVSDSSIRAEGVRRALSPAIGRCYVKHDVLSGGVRHNCNGHSGFQYASDEEQQALEACPARDVWSDLGGLFAGHAKAGRGPDDPVVADCDDLAPAALSVAGYLAWFIDRDAPELAGLGGLSYDRLHDDHARFAVAITHPKGANIAHAYGLTNRVPPAPQPRIALASAGGGETWYVWDPAAHWGMNRPPDDFYRKGELVGFEIRREDLHGLDLAL